MFKLLTVVFILANLFYNSQCREIARDTVGLEEKLSRDTFHEAKLLEERQQLHEEKEHNGKVQEDELEGKKIHEEKEHGDQKHEEQEHKVHHEAETAPEEKNESDSESKSDEWLDYDSDEYDWEVMDGWSSEEYEEDELDCEEKKFFQLHQLLDFLRSWVTIYFDDSFY